MTTFNPHDFVRDAEAKMAEAKPNGKAEAWHFTMLRDLRPALDRREIVKDFIPARALVEIHAEAGGGKSAVIVDLCLHIADGREYRGRRVERQPVIYCALEGHGGIDNRVIAAAAELDITEAPFALVKASDNFRDPEAAAKAAALAKQLVAEHGGDCPVVVIDTFTAALGAGGSDCDPADVTAFLANVQEHLLGRCSVLIAHHYGKDASRGARGWSGLRAALDVEAEIDRDDDLRVLRITKSRDGSDVQAGMCFRLHGREIGTNTYGEPVTAVVVEHLADEDAAKRGKRLSPKARAALNVLWEAIKDRTKSFPIADEPGKRAVLITVWEGECMKPGVVSQATTEKERRRKFRDARAELEAAEAVAIDNDGQRIYPTPRK